ncbi:transporter [Halobacteriales archaeon SW_7_65_23]|nr:MAG: transporter [Halobacteriales archaeon SW_7_65_23]
MKIGQTSIIVFVSKVVGSAIGFFATVYFARELGAEVLGIYALVLTIVSWMILLSELGIGKAVTKRISEGKEQGAYLAASLVWIIALIVLFAGCIIVLRPVFERYIDGFSQYISLSVVWVIIGLLAVNIFFKITYRILKGQRLVHIVGILNTVQVGGQSLIQLALVIGGAGLGGLFMGWTIGGLIVALIGLYWVRVRPRVPSKQHFRSLYDYAKYSWLGSLKSRTFNDVDILLLGVFVQSSLVGVYSVAWSIAKFLELFGGAISQTMFPEISYMATQKKDQAVSGLINDSLAYTGLIAIPGLVGGGILAERLLRIYGPEFRQGASVLILLVLATLLYSYLEQLLNALNGINRPDLSFRINVVFISLNAGLNVLLIPEYGIDGAAVASVVSVGFSLVLAYRSLARLVTFKTPIGEITYQILAALMMGILIVVGLGIVSATSLGQHNFALVILLVISGAGIYLLTLLGLSKRFRQTILRNLPNISRSSA